MYAIFGYSRGTLIFFRSSKVLYPYKKSLQSFRTKKISCSTFSPNSLSKLNPPQKNLQAPRKKTKSFKFLHKTPFISSYYGMLVHPLTFFHLWSHSKEFSKRVSNSSFFYFYSKHGSFHKKKFNDLNRLFSGLVDDFNITTPMNPFTYIFLTFSI